MTLAALPLTLDQSTWLDERRRWHDYADQQLPRRLQWAIHYARQHTRQPDRLITHFDSLIILLNEARTRSALHPLALDLIAALHPWPVRWGYWEIWEQQLRFGSEAARRLSLPTLQARWLAELAALLVAPAHQHDARRLSQQALNLARRLRVLQPWAVAGAAQVAACIKRGEINLARTLLAHLDADWPRMIVAATAIEQVSARALIDFQRIDLVTRTDHAAALAACHDLIAALTVHPEIDLELLAEAYSTFGITLFRGEVYPAAVTALEHACELRLQTHDRAQELTERINLGLVALWAGNLVKSATALQQGTTLAERLNFRRHVYTTLSTLSITYMLEGQLDKALDCVNRALTLAQEVADRTEVARAFNNRGAIWLCRGELDKALRDFQTFQTDYQAQATVPVQIGLCLDLAWAYCQQQKWDVAEELIQRALKLGQPPRRGLRMLVNRLRALLRPRVESERLLREALVLARDLQRRLDEAACLLSLAAIVEDESERETLWAAGVELLQECGADAWLENCTPAHPPFIPPLI